MLNECKGEKFEEVLGLFSTLVMFKVMKEGDEFNASITEKLVASPTLSGEESKSLLPLAVAHRASLTNLLEKKARLRAKHRQEKDAMDLKKTALHIPAETLDSWSKHSPNTAEYARKFIELTKSFENRWAGGSEWKRITLDGKQIDIPDLNLDRPSPEAGYEIPSSTVKGVFTSAQPSPPADAGQRLNVQQVTVERWQDFLKSFHALSFEERSNLESIGTPQLLKDIGLSLSGHQNLMINANEIKHNNTDEPSLPQGSVSEKVNEYEKMTADMRERLSNAESTFTYRRVDPVQMTIRPFDVEKSSDDLARRSFLEKSEESKNMKKSHVPSITDQPSERNHSGVRGSVAGTASSPQGSVSDPVLDNATSPEETLGNVKEKSDMIIEKLTRITPGGPPSMVEHESSLEERTRKSIMALVKTEGGIESSDSLSDGFATSQIRVPDSVPSTSNLKSTGRETLLERTRQSMSLLPIKPRASRKSLLKQPSKTYPTNPFETPKRAPPRISESSTPPEELFSQDAKYDSVFKSRPRIALSPTQSPSFGCIEDVHESTGELAEEDKVGDEMASSPLARPREKSDRR